MSRLCLEGYFVIYENKFFPIKYITQNKKDTSDLCFKKLLSMLGKKYEIINDIGRGFFIAFTHDIIINRLERNDVKIIIKIPLLKSNISNLKKYLHGDLTNCVKCSDRTMCKIYKKDSNKKDSNKKNIVKEYCVVFHI